MDIGNALQQAMLDRAGAYLGLLWLFLAICAGLYASECKRRFWTWVILSLIGGPIAWVRLYRIGYAIPTDVAVECRHCGKRTRNDMKRCLSCKRMLAVDKKDVAGDLGRTAATWLFTAKVMASKAGKAAASARAKTGER